ncbi:MAG: SPASM domain-containing protein, partial [Nanoarchaeota archaeon]
RQMKAFVEEKPNFYYCAATGREVSVDPEGYLAACPAFLNTKMFPFNLKDNPDLENNAEFKLWARRTPMFNKKCHKCIAFGICGGGCAFNAYKNHKDINGMDRFYCNYAISITEWLLKDLNDILERRRK